MALIAHWPLDGRLDDVSGNGYHLSSSSPVYVNSGRLGKCLDIKNSTESPYIKNKIIKDVFNNSEYTICFWMNQTTLNHPWRAFITTKGRKFRLEHGPDNYNIDSPVTTQYVQWMNYFTTINDGHLQQGRNTGLTANQWVFVSISRKDNVYQMYFNGVLNNSVIRNNMTEFLDDHLILGPGVHIQPDDLLSDIRIYNHACSSLELKKIMNEPYIDLDFKGTIPPTVNWLDDDSKFGLVTGATKITTNSFNIIRNSEWGGGIFLKPTQKEFTISFKLKLLEGVITRLGGHSVWNDTGKGLGSKESKVFFNDMEMVGYGWSDGTNIIPFNVEIGDTIDVKLYIKLPTVPIWSESGLYIQPNRGDATRCVCLVYDLQIEEGSLVTPFCTWSRDYMEIPDKSSYRKSITSDSRNIFTLPTFKQNSISTVGSKSSLYFTKENSLCLKDVTPLPVMTTLMSLRISDIEFDTIDDNKIVPIFSIVKLNSSSTDLKRIYLLYNSRIRKLILFYESLQYIVEHEVVGLEDLFISIRFSSSGILISIGDRIFNTGFNNNPVATSYDIILGKRNPQTIGNYSFEISDLKIFPYTLTDQEVLQEYNKLKSRVKSFAGAFDNIPTLSVEVPRLWERNPNTIGIDCFANNPNIPQSQAIPMGWGGSFKQPDSSILAHGNTLDMVIKPIQEVIYIDPHLNDNIATGLIVNDDQTQTTEVLTLVHKTRF